MIEPYSELANRIRGEVPDLDRLMVKVLWAWEQCKIKPDEQGVFIDSIALNLHGLFSGLERIFELIEPIITRIPQTWPNIQDELLAFADFIEQAGAV